uniref:Uncharacterized protein n=1 Tax=Klebsiella pneumoniae TaxID=573 RepID=A0A8B0SVL0_KLEPN|nr:hypothetical protein [Klebsiella pneumoniae]
MLKNPKLMMKPVYQMNGGSMQLFKPTYCDETKSWFFWGLVKVLRMRYQ